MGSSKKRKEKREKKKHKKRSRSRSHERSKRSHKHSREKKHRRDTRSKDPDFDRKKYSESSEDEYVERNRTVDIRSETSGSGSRLQAAYVSSPTSTSRRIVEHYTSGGEEDDGDDFDPESLLEEKLLENEVYSSKSNKPSKKNYPNILETLMGKVNPNLEVFRQVIMKGDSMQNFPGDFQISITNRMPESISTVKAEDDSQDQFEYLPPPQKKIRVKEEPIYEAEQREQQYMSRIDEWEDTEDQPIAPRSSQKSLSVSEMNKLRAKLGLNPLQEAKTIPGIEPESDSTEFSQPLHSVIETNRVREKPPSMRSSQTPTVIPGLDLEPDTAEFQSQESLSISETNKLRARLGLKPLQVSESIPGVEAESRSPKQSQQTHVTSEANKSRTKMSKKPSQVSKPPVPEPEAEPDNDGQSQVSLSISQTNELRAKLGLKPLQVTESIPGLGAAEDEKTPTASTSTKEIFVKTENLAEKREAEKLREKIKTQKEKRKIIEKLSKVKGIAESDSEDESAAAWVQKSRKLQEEKEKAEKRAKLLEEMDAEFGIGALVEEEFEKKDKSYTAANLKGLTVSHAVDSLKEGHDVILTLKDKDVLDEEEDVLENVSLVDEERYAKNVENRKKKPVYVPYEEPEFDEFGILKKKNILSKYDEEENNSQKKTFKLGDENYQDKEKELELIRMKLKQKQGVSLEMPNMKVASEYYTPEEMVQFKKPKKKVRKVRRRILKADDLVVPDVEETSGRDFGRRNYTETELDDAFIYGEVPRIQPEVEMETDEVPVETEEQDVIGPSEDLTGVVVDEDKAEKELNTALNKARRLKQRKTVVSAPEKIVEMIKKSNPDDMDTTPESKSAPIVLNCTAEFCRTLGEIPTYGMSGNRDEEADELLDFERELIEERKKQEMEAQNRGAWNEVDIDEKPAEIHVKENEPILEDEPDMRVGVAGALELAQKKGYLDKDTKKAAASHRVSQLQAQSYTIEEKFYDDDKFGKRDRYTGPIQDFREKLGYKPDIKLEYIDDSGRLLTAKEAFRYLSHKFHGKGPGKNKVDKRMKKLEQETRLKQMSSTDTPLNTVKLLQAKQKEMQSPYIVLSGGSKTLTQTMISKTKPT